MEDIEKKFKDAVDFMNKYKDRIEDLNSDNDILLEVYGLYKQATCGNCNIPQPSVFNLRDTAKYNAWIKYKDNQQVYVMKLYVIKINKIIKNANKIE